MTLRVCGVGRARVEIGERFAESFLKRLEPGKVYRFFVAVKTREVLRDVLGLERHLAHTLHDANGIA